MRFVGIETGSHQFSGGGTQYVDPIKDVRPHDSKSQAPGPPPPPKRSGKSTRWGRKIFYGVVAVVVVGGTVWLFSDQPEYRTKEQRDRSATAEARAATALADS